MDHSSFEQKVRAMMARKGREPEEVEEVEEVEEPKFGIGLGMTTMPLLDINVGRGSSKDEEQWNAVNAKLDKAMEDLLEVKKQLKKLKPKKKIRWGSAEWKAMIKKDFEKREKKSEKMNKDIKRRFAEMDANIEMMLKPAPPTIEAPAEEADTLSWVEKHHFNMLEQAMSWNGGN